MPQKLHIKTFGCQMNGYDSARMAGLLADSCGLAVTDCAEEADVLLLNTCSVREKAQEKVFSQLGRWREWKLARPALVIGVGGCVASEIISAVRGHRPGLSLTSDFIVGFPGESEDDFAATLSLVDELQFDQSFSFLYSPRPGTPAAFW